MYYCVYKVEANNTTTLHSIEHTEPVSLPPGYGYAIVDNYVGEWDPINLTIIPVSSGQRVISRQTFIERFTPTEWINLVSLKTTDSVVAATFERLLLLDTVYPESDFVVQMAAHFVQQGYLTQQRVDEVLA